MNKKCREKNKVPVQDKILTLSKYEYLYHAIGGFTVSHDIESLVVFVYLHAIICIFGGRTMFPAHGKGFRFAVDGVRVFFFGK